MKQHAVGATGDISSAGCPKGCDELRHVVVRHWFRWVGLLIFVVLVLKPLILLVLHLPLFPFSEESLEESRRRAARGQTGLGGFRVLLRFRPPSFPIAIRMNWKGLVLGSFFGSTSIFDPLTGTPMASQNISAHSSN